MTLEPIAKLYLPPKNFINDSLPSRFGKLTYLNSYTNEVFHTYTCKTRSRCINLDCTRHFLSHYHCGNKYSWLDRYEAQSIIFLSNGAAASVILKMFLDSGILSLMTERQTGIYLFQNIQICIYVKNASNELFWCTIFSCFTGVVTPICTAYIAKSSPPSLARDAGIFTTIDCTDGE